MYRIHAASFLSSAFWGPPPHPLWTSYMKAPSENKQSNKDTDLEVDEWVASAVQVVVVHGVPTVGHATGLKEMME